MAQPSLSTFLTRFPEFACVEHSLIIAILAEAPIFVDLKWGEYEELGAMLYTAHELTMQGQGSTAAARKIKSGGVTQITSGSHKVQYSDHAGAMVGWEATPYGARFRDLANRIGAIMVSVL